MQVAASPTIWAFMEADADVVCLMGARGEGKTTGGYLRLLHKAAQLPGHARPLRAAVIRDTWTNLERTTMATLEELERQGLRVQWAEGRTQARLGGDLVHVYFLGIDTSGAASKLQGFGVGAIWLEEPSPAADISGGIPADVLALGVTSLRQPYVQGWAQITQNPPDADHWTLTMATRIRELTARRGVLPLRFASFSIPTGENRFISDADRQRNRTILEATGRHDLVARLVEGRVGYTQVGEAVMPEYDDVLHVAPDPLPILPGMPIVRLYDFGLTPSILWTQVTPLGSWHLLWAVQGVNQGMEQLIETQVKPWESVFLEGHRGGWRDIGDPAGRQREQSNSERSAAQVVERMLHTTFEAGPVQWGERRDSLKAILSRMTRGRPTVQVDPEALLIRRCLRGGWHYPKDGLGRITSTVEAAKRASGLHDHIGHALTYGAGVLFPVSALIERYTVKRPRPALLALRHGWMVA